MQAIAQAVTSHPSTNVLSVTLLIPLIQYLKKSQFPLFNTITDSTAIYWSLAISALTALGMHFSFTHSATGFGITIDGTFQGLIVGLIEWGKQFAAQHWGYKIYRLNDCIREVLKQVEQSKELLSNQLNSIDKSGLGLDENSRMAEHATGNR